MQKNSEMSASIDDIWASMNSAEASTVKKVTTTIKKKKEIAKNTNKVKKLSKEKGINSIENVDSAPTDVVVPSISYDEMKQKISRDLNACSDEDGTTRKKGLIRLQKTLFVEATMKEEDYSATFDDIARVVFKRFADPIEKCRELAQKITESFFERSKDFVPVLGYYFPALVQRLPPGLGYDDDLKLFVTDMEAHDAFRRGRAVDRQDKGGAEGLLVHQVVETSEEIRFQTCKTLCKLINRVESIGVAPILHPYFQEMVVFLQAQLRDPYPELKMISCNALESLALSAEYEPGMKFFSVALVRAILPVLRHRHAKVRAAAVSAVRACMIVPDRSKRKAAGSEAIADLVGFREENVLQIVAFYKPDVQFNYLAELVTDKSTTVREKLVDLLFSLLTEIGDRYDHQTRLLPYLLDLLSDEAESVAKTSLACLQLCGKQYEDEHPDEIIERRQYGVDGDNRINLDKPFPFPFTERPRIGMRLYVRGNTKRFLSALVRELTNWVSTTRLKSANLLKMVIVLCEEHLTMEAHSLFPEFIKALRFSREDKDTTLHKTLLEVYEILGRYIVPELSVYYILPRLRGDPDIVQFGVDSETRITVMEFLQALLLGAKTNMLVPLFDEIVTVLTDPFVISLDSVKLQNAATDVLITLFESVKGKGNSIIEAHYVSTGRLTSRKATFLKAFKFLLINLSNNELRSQSAIAIKLLACLETDGEANGIETLFLQHGPALLNKLIEDYEVDGMWTAVSPEHQLLVRLTENSSNSILSNATLLAKYLNFLCKSVEEATSSNYSSELEIEILSSFSDLIQMILKPIYNVSWSKSNVELYTGLSSTNIHSSYQKRVVEWNLSSVDCESCQYGLAITHDIDAVKLAVGVIESNLKTILDAGILHTHWSQQPELQLQRLRLLDALSGASVVTSAVSFVSEDLNDDYVVIDSPSKQAKHNLITLPTPPFLTGLNLMLFITPISECILPAASLPSNPSSVRENVLISFEHLLRSLCNHVEVKLEKPVAFRKRQLTKSQIDAKSCILTVINFLLELVNDSLDEVRIIALHALCTALPLVASNDEIEVIKSDLLVTNALSTYPSYNEIITKLLIVLITESDLNSEFMDELDTTLRCYAVLDPVLFEQMIRLEFEKLFSTANEEINPLSSKSKAAKHELSSRFSGLVDHACLLQQFEK